MMCGKLLLGVILVVVDDIRDVVRAEDEMRGQGGCGDDFTLTTLGIRASIENKLHGEGRLQMAEAVEPHRIPCISDAGLADVGNAIRATAIV